jgi:hypothetical protein
MQPPTERMTTAEYRTVWRCADATVERDALAFWRALDLLPEGADPRRRLDALCVVAYRGRHLVGTLETPLRRIELVRSRLAMIRVIAPSERRGASLASRLLPARLVLKGQKLLEEWSLAHPEEKVMGLGAIVPPGTFGQKVKRAVWEPSGLVLANKSPGGQQLRVCWFPHARVE